LREFAADTDLELVAYSPLARGQVFENDTIADIAEAHDASPAQVSLAWLREKGVTAIPKATGEDHIRDNWGSVALELDAEEIDRIDAIEERDRRVHPDFAPDAW
jgi:2,5-diketo-D-gluconate reductase B